MESLKKNIPGILLFAFILKFLFWAQSYTDYSFSDEFYSLMKALGVEVYNKTLYVRLLSVFSFFSPDFYQLQKINNIASVFFLGAAFYFYHSKKKVQASTNILITSLFILSPINIALTRRLHYWALAFFFLLMGWVADLEEQGRKKILCGGFLLLSFLRYEFAFAFVLSVFLLIPPKMVRARLFGLLLLTGNVALLIYYFGPGMRQLVHSSYGQGMAEGVLLLVRNVLYFSYNSLHSFDVLFLLYSPSLIVAFILLVSTVRSWRKNFYNWLIVLENDFFPGYLPAVAAILCVRYNDFYAIMGFVLLMSSLNFLFNENRPISIFILLLILIFPAFFLQLPDYRHHPLMFYSLRQKGMIHREVLEKMRTDVQLKSQRGLNVISDDKKAFEVLFPGVKSEFRGTEVCAEIGIKPDVILVGPNDKNMSTCKGKVTADFKRLELLPGYLFAVRL